MAEKRCLPMDSRPYGIFLNLSVELSQKWNVFLRKLKDQDARAFDFLCNFALEHQYIDNSNPGKFIDKKFFKNLESDFFLENFDSISN